MKNQSIKEYMSIIGRRGGKARADKYGKDKLKEWGKKGGRPVKSKKEKVDNSSI